MTRSVLLLAIATLLTAACGDSIEVSPSYPLGKLEDIDATLGDPKYFKKSFDKFATNECFDDHDLYEKLAELKVVKYEFVGAGSAAGVFHVKLLLSPTNQVLGMVGRFRSMRADFTDSGGRVPAFVGRMWKAVSGGPALFEKQYYTNYDDEEYLLSTFETPTARGRWEKKSTQGNVEVGGTIYDQVLLWAK